MTRVAAELREFRPRRLALATGVTLAWGPAIAMIARSPAGDLLEAGAEAGRLPHRPGARAVCVALALAGRPVGERQPVGGHALAVVVELEGELGMAGGDQVVIDGPAGPAEMAGKADAGPHLDVAQVGHAGGDRLLVGPALGAVPLEPAARRAVAALARDAVLELQRPALQPRRHRERMAGETELALAGVADVQAAGDHPRAVVVEHAVGAGMEVLLLPDEVLVLPRRASSAARRCHGSCSIRRPWGRGGSPSRERVVDLQRAARLPPPEERTGRPGWRPIPVSSRARPPASRPRSMVPACGTTSWPPLLVIGCMMSAHRWAGGRGGPPGCRSPPSGNGASR
jgi:hypothetical protein